MYSCHWEVNNILSAVLSERLLEASLNNRPGESGVELRAHCFEKGPKTSALNRKPSAYCKP